MTNNGNDLRRKITGSITGTGRVLANGGVEPAEETSLALGLSLSRSPRLPSLPVGPARSAHCFASFPWPFSLSHSLRAESRVLARVLTRARLVTLRARAPPRGTRVRSGGAPRPCGLPLQLTRDPGAGAREGSAVLFSDSAGPTRTRSRAWILHLLLQARAYRLQLTFFGGETSATAKEKRTCASVCRKNTGARLLRSLDGLPGEVEQDMSPECRDGDFLVVIYRGTEDDGVRRPPCPGCWVVVVGSRHHPPGSINLASSPAANQR
jgi:hypothetical protein